LIWVAGNCAERLRERSGIADKVAEIRLGRPAVGADSIQRIDTFNAIQVVQE
jgi:hypothetical protein